MSKSDDYEPLRAESVSSLADVVHDGPASGSLNGELRPGWLFRRCVDAAPNAMLLVDDRGCITLVNEEAERMFGYSRAELLGRPVELLVPAAGIVRHMESRPGFPEQPSRRRLGLRRDLRARRKDGTEVLVEIGLNPIMVADRPFTLAAIIDLTERQALLERLSEAVEARNAFLSVASHELRTPITAMQLTIEGLERLVHRASDHTIPTERLAAGLAATTRQVRRLDALITELLDVSRITSGRLRLECELVDLGQLAQMVVERFVESSTAHAASISIETTMGVVGYWDRGRLDQVLTNLLSNAIKYGAGKPIDVHISRNGEWAILTVRDHGIGIAPANQARIFQRFERLVSDRHIAGFGLGLWICRQLVEAHGGSIAVDSEPELGSVFRVSLPPRPPAPQEEADWASP